MENSTAKQPIADPVAPESEEALLADQAAAAQRAISQTLERMRTDLGASADLAAWARKYPWPTVGAAAALGFLAVVAAARPPARQAVDQSPAPDGLAEAAHRAASGPTDRGFFASLISEVLRNLATAAQGALLAAIAARFQSATPSADPPASTDDVSAADGPVATDSNGVAGV